MKWAGLVVEVTDVDRLSESHPRPSVTAMLAHDELNDPVLYKSDANSVALISGNTLIPSSQADLLGSRLEIRWQIVKHSGTVTTAGEAHNVS